MRACGNGLAGPLRACVAFNPDLSDVGFECWFRQDIEVPRIKLTQDVLELLFDLRLPLGEKHIGARELDDTVDGVYFQMQALKIGLEFCIERTVQFLSLLLELIGLIGFLLQRAERIHHDQMMMSSSATLRHQLINRSPLRPSSYLKSLPWRFKTPSISPTVSCSAL